MVWFFSALPLDAKLARGFQNVLNQIATVPANCASWGAVAGVVDPGHRLQKYFTDYMLMGLTAFSWRYFSIFLFLLKV
jgi:hypothetical protein